MVAIDASSIHTSLFSVSASTTTASGASLINAAPICLLSEIAAKVSLFSTKINSHGLERLLAGDISTVFCKASCTSCGTACALNLRVLRRVCAKSKNVFIDLFFFQYTIKEVYSYEGNWYFHRKH